MDAILVNNISKYFNLSKGKKHKNQNSIAKNNSNIVRAVENVSFIVEKGEIFGFLGPNGAGKTTTIRMMTGVLKPTIGTIEIFGEDIWKKPILVKQITGNVPEEANVYIELTGWQNLMLMGEIYGVPKEEREDRAESLLKKFELYEKRDLKSRKYSKGMKQRLLLCLALMSNPKLLFLDEPTSGLDVQSSRIIKQLIKEYNKLGTTIFLTTHDMDVANELCDRIAIINKGKIIRLDTPEKLKLLTQEYQAIDCIFTDKINTEEIERFESVTEVQEIKGGVHVIVKDVHKALIDIIEFSKSHSYEFKQINTHQPTLEDAFLKIIERGDEN
ncbi:MAG: ATP-binding cassette domain-containing protein [Candidatus Lokiarchaeota archaeon]|nr:ATP-binding cassette domain-containing protein [Candidatus Lokiarchaeota archaeon]